ncbi:MAG: hypothetical protein EHM55_07625 [Acidobacteria bacterium]|nr:MAG: hypothetical protein EHM55_07625 [Acidobacteriota bacterium]
MLSRRELIAGGAAVHMAAGDGAAAQRDDDNSRELYSIRDALIALRQDHTVVTPTVNELRTQQRNFFRLNQRFPQCIDVGIRVWERMQDWHIAHLRPLTIQRTSDGHWQMDFIMSVIVLKYELPENEIGQAYDR